MHTTSYLLLEKACKSDRKILNHKNFQVRKRITHPKQKFLRERETDNCACWKKRGSIV